MSSDWMLAQGTVDFRNEEIMHRNERTMKRGKPYPPPWQCGCRCWNFWFRKACYRCGEPRG